MLPAVGQQLGALQLRNLGVRGELHEGIEPLARLPVGAHSNGDVSRFLEQIDPDGRCGAGSLLQRKLQRFDGFTRLVVAVPGLGQAEGGHIPLRSQRVGTGRHAQHARPMTTVLGEQ
jgi:hypothetical protein